VTKTINNFSLDHLIGMKILNIQEKFLNNLNLEQKSLNKSNNNSFEEDCQEVSLSERTEVLNKLTSKSLTNKKIIKYLQNKQDNFINSMNVKCDQMDNLLPDPAEKKKSPIKEATLGRGFCSH